MLRIDTIVSSLLIVLLIFPTRVFGGVDFDDTDDYIPCAAETNYGIEGGPATLACWVRLDSNLANNEARVFAKGGTGYMLIRLANTSISGCTSNYCFGFIKDYATTDLSTIANNVITAGTWHHIAATWDGTATSSTGIKLYVDGAVKTHASDTNGSGAENSDSAGLWQIGNSSTPGTRDMDGVVDDCAAWGAVLSAAEIAQLASARNRGIVLQTSPANLKGYWRLDDEEDGSSGDAYTGDMDTFTDIITKTTCSGDDGANNTGLTATASPVLSYP